MTRIAIDRPGPTAPGRLYGNLLEVSGWAGAPEAIRSVELRAADGPWVLATFCQPRPDVGSAHPTFVNGDRTGFQVFVPFQGTPPDRIQCRVTSGTGDSAPYEATIKIGKDQEAFRSIQVDPDEAPDACGWCHFDGPLLAENVRRGPFTLWTCPRCGFGNTAPLPTAEALATLYETEYWNHAPLGPDNLTPSHDSDWVAGMIERYGNGGKRSLEIGCGQGTLLLGLHQRGFAVHGQDLSQNSARAAEQKIGATVWRGPLHGIPDDRRFDCIVTRHVIEHSVTPRADFDWMLGHLAPGGIIVLLTPNRSSLASRVLGAAWEWYVPPIHVGYFAPETLVHIADATGARLLHLSTREGDGAPLEPTLRAVRDYESAEQPAWRREEIDRLLDTTNGNEPLDEWLLKHAPRAGVGQELVAVFAES